MHYNTRLLYTPPLEPHEFNDRALILDTETIGSGPLTEVIKVAHGDTRGDILYQVLVQIGKYVDNQRQAPGSL